jgi:cytochrome c biogenesis protein CcmG/thiol:disulfide interchange protein DsbE
MTGARRWLLPLAALPFLALLAFGLTRDADFFPTPLIDREAPQWRLESLAEAGDSLSLADLRGRVVVMTSCASWCLPCRAEHGVLIQASRAWPAEDVEVIGVVYDDSRRNAQRFLDELGEEWRHVIDTGSRTAIDYGVHGVPETFFLTREGKIGMKHIGPVTWDVVQTNVDSLRSLPTSVAGPAEEGTL